ncbi:hypothetical protein C5167_036189 [Papaver somniferum]|uniref:uncharacterized protein LOC113343077 n=1 Tax=Papaver somniferum TaxID=3469 RepID=UPI000E6FAAF0|nr:uncharacterized protein LOC113343077 [Papaver somniferum]RZC92942.1 hypothetical protein C5167_036189 [Papaver somniferum]
MATSILLRSARSAVKAANIASRCLPATGAKAWTAAIPLSWRLGSVATIFSIGYPGCNQKLALKIAREREAVKVTDDIINSEDKLLALFLRWLSINEHHFDVDDRKAFKERFEIFKKTARRVHKHNQTKSSCILVLTYFSDLTPYECAHLSYKVYPKKEVKKEVYI